MFNRFLKFPLIGLLIAVFICKQFLWVYLIAPWQAPDELAHYSYIETLYYEHKLPELGKTLFAADAEAVGPVSDPSANLQSTVLNPQNLDTPFPSPVGAAQFSAGSKLNWIAQHPPLYYTLLLPFYAFMPHDNIQLCIFLLRFFSILLGAITLYFSHKTLTKILPTKSLFNFTVVAALAFLPTFSYSSAIINNDNLVIALSAILIYLLVSWSKNLSVSAAAPIEMPSATGWVALWIGGVLGLLAITKTTSLPLVAVALIVFAAGFFVAQNASARRKIFFSILKISGIILVISGWWYLRNYFIFKTFLPEIKDAIALNPVLLSQHPYLTTLFPEVVPRLPQFGLVDFLFTKNFIIEYYKNIWGVFGRFFIQLNFWQYAAIFTLTFAGVLGGLKTVFYKVRHQNKFNFKDFFNSGNFVLALTFFLMASTITCKLWQISAARGFLAAMHGRYFLPAALPLLFFLIKGFLNLFPKKTNTKTYETILISLVFLFVLNDFATIFFTIIPKS